MITTGGLGNLGSLVAGGLSFPPAAVTVSPNDLKQGFCSQLGYQFETLAEDYLDRSRFTIDKDDAPNFRLLPYELQSLDFRGAITRQRIITSMVDDRLHSTSDTLTGNIGLKGNMEGILFALMAVLGDPAVAATGPKYSYVFGTGFTEAKTFVLMNITSIGWDIFKGVYGTAMSLTGKAGAGFRVGMTVSGREMTHTPGPAAPNIPDRSTKWDTLFFNDTVLTLKNFPGVDASGFAMSVSNLILNVRARYARNKTLRAAPLSDLPLRSHIIFSGSFTISRHDMTSDFIFDAVKKNRNVRGTLNIKQTFDANNSFEFELPVLLRVISGVPSSRIVPIRISFETEALDSSNDGFLVKAEYIEDLS